jgi:bifunctional N-acetylglucosamine-1-phosphate-uridyltransferase/glucosamine-1-phosphate-acetyltransferase GlmU-like protein
MIPISDFIEEFPIQGYADRSPWDISKLLPDCLVEIIPQLGDDFSINDGVALHRSVVIERGVILKAPIIVLAKSFIGAHAYLRGGVFISESVVIGPGSEIKSSVIGSHSSIAHFNFIGDSIIGSHVNFEAGAITANYHNDKIEKRVFSIYNAKVIDTGVEKFGSLVGDHSKIGANAVLSPGTILPKHSIVGRLQLINQHS